MCGAGRSVQMGVMSARRIREQNVENIAFQTYTLKYMDTKCVPENALQVHKNAVTMGLSSHSRQQLAKLLRTVVEKVTLLAGENAGSKKECSFKTIESQL